MEYTETEGEYDPNKLTFKTTLFVKFEDYTNKTV